MTNTYHTRVKKDAYGKWEAETMINNINGYDWHISTCKRSSRGIVSNAQACKDTTYGFEFVVFQDPSVTLCQVKKRGTEKTIKEVHKMGLVEFDKLIASGELPSRELSE